MLVTGRMTTNLRCGFDTRDLTD